MMRANCHSSTAPPYHHRLWSCKHETTTGGGPEIQRRFRLTRGGSGPLPRGAAPPEGRPCRRVMVTCLRQDALPGEGKGGFPMSDDEGLVHELETDVYDLRKGVEHLAFELERTRRELASLRTAVANLEEQLVPSILR